MRECSTQVRKSSSKHKWEIPSSFQYLSQTKSVPWVLVTILGRITSRDDSTYSIGTSQGTLAVSYSRNQFEVYPTNLLSVDSIPAVTITQTKAMQSVSLGVADCSACKFRIAKLRDVSAGKLAEAAILNAIKGVLVLTSTPSTSSCWFAYTSD